MPKGHIFNSLTLLLGVISTQLQKAKSQNKFQKIYLAGIIVLKSSPEGQSFNFKTTVSPLFVFCRSIKNAVNY